MNRLMAALIHLLVILNLSPAADAAVVKNRNMKTLILKLSPRELDSIVPGQVYRMNDQNGRMRAVLNIKKIFVGKGVIATIVSLRGPLLVNERFQLEELATIR